jgi:DNA polymerase-3 subunit delta
MQLRAEQFQASLEGSLPAAIVLCASEPLLLVEARQALRAAAARQGFVERESFDIGVDASFEDFRLAAQSLGLFARQRMFDVRMSGSKLDHEGAAILKEYLEFPDPHAVLLISVPELSNAVLKLAWLKNFEAAGWVVPLWAPKAAEVPAWIKRRASQLGVQLTADAVSFLSERIEGNLLAAQQELSMLSLRMTRIVE